MYLVQVSHQWNELGEDKDHPVTELLQPGPNSKGWESPRFGSFPQTIILQFQHPVVIRQIQFLSHQAKIATKVELYVYVPTSPQPPDPEEIPNLTFKRIGYLSLDSNERSGFTARELKSVYIEAPSYLLKILLHKCHVNKHNIFSQVGLIAINCLGEPLNFTNQQIPSQISHTSEGYDPITSQKLKILNEAKLKAVEDENFDEAKRIKSIIDKLKAVGKDLADLEVRKRAAIENEDYESAKLLKQQIENLRSSALEERRREAPRRNPVPAQYEFEDQKNPEVPYIEAKPIEEKPPNARMPVEEIKGEFQSRGAEDPDSDLKNSIVNPTMTKQKSQQPPEYEEEKPHEENNSDAEPLSLQAKKIAEPYYGLIDMKLLEKLFSKNWVLREAGLNDISNELSTKDFVLITMQNDEEKIMSTLIGFVGYIINDKVTQVSLRAMGMIEELLNFYPNEVVSSKALYNTNINACMGALMERIGDSNPKVKSKAEEVCLKLAIDGKIALTSFVMHCIKVAKKGAIPAKAFQGKLGLLTALFKHLGEGAKALVSQSLIEFALNGAKNGNGEVRNAGYSLLIEIYKHIGTKIDTYLNGLRPAQKEVLQTELEKLGSVAPSEPKSAGVAV